MRPIYLDYNATTPVAPEVAQAMRPFLEEHFGNPASPHPYGAVTRAAVEEARGRVAAALCAAPDEIVFTSGGTEANNHAIRGAALARRDRGDHIVTSAVEHAAVADVCGLLESQGFRVTRVPVDGTGRVDPADVARALTPGTILVTVMHANNEVGTIQPIREIARLAREAGALVHTDAAQTVGKIGTDVVDLGVDLLSVAGHKVYGPKGVGALYIRRGVRIENLMVGAGHEAGRRPGTENLLGIVGLGKAMEIAARDLPARAAHLRALRDRLHALLAARVPGLALNGHPEERLPNTLSVSFPGRLATDLLAAAREEVAASAGAACHSGTPHVSATLAAMGVPRERALGTVRLSTGRFLAEAEVEAAAEALAAAFERG